MKIPGKFLLKVVKIPKFGCKMFTRSERCNLVKYLYPVIYWRLYTVKVRVGERSYNMHEITILIYTYIHSYNSYIHSYTMDNLHNR